MLLYDNIHKRYYHFYFTLWYRNSVPSRVRSVSADPLRSLVIYQSHQVLHKAGDMLHPNLELSAH